MVLAMSLEISYLGQKTTLFSGPSILNELSNNFKNLPLHLPIIIKHWF